MLLGSWEYGRGWELNLHIPKWTPTLGVGIPMDFRVFKGRLQGSKPSRLRIFLYHWKALGTWMFKMGLHDPFGYLEYKLWPKKGPRIKCHFDSRPLKIRNCLNFLVCRWRCTYHGNLFDKGYNISLDLTSIGGLHTKLWASKVVGVLILRILTKWHLGASPMAKHKEYYKGEGGGFPQV